MKEYERIKDTPEYKEKEAEILDQLKQQYLKGLDKQRETIAKQ